MPEGAPGELKRDWGQGMEGQDTGNGFPLLEGRVRRGIRKKLFPMREVRPWHRLSRAAVAAPSLKALEAKWMELGATWERGRCSCPWQEGRD